ncbi:hypothetical protein DIPPA_20926, partial [Diplonema papillatum]|eukprot:gene6635-10161_t
MTDAQSEKESQRLLARFYARADAIEPGVVLSPSGDVYGDVKINPAWSAKGQELEPSDPFFCFTGVTMNVGAAYCTGLVTGALNGMFQGMKMRESLTYQHAWSSLFNDGSHCARLWGNRAAATMFSVGLVEAGLREFVIRRAREKYFAGHSEEDLSVFETDARKLSPLAACVVVPAFRLRRHRSTVIQAT